MKPDVGIDGIQRLDGGFLQKKGYLECFQLFHTVVLSCLKMSRRFLSKGMLFYVMLYMLSPGPRP